MHSPKAGGSFLLIGSDQSSTCLSCHQSSTDTGPNGYHVSTIDAKLTGTGVPLQRTPGGDFGWVKKNYTYAGVTEGGWEHGHNIVAADFNYTVDPSNTLSPGGSYAASQLQCNSCHDPHGQYRRRLDGTIGKTGGAIWASGSYPSTTIGGVAVPNEPRVFAATSEPLTVGVYRLLAGAGYDKVAFAGVPAAKVPSSYNRTEATSDTRVAYGNASTSGHTSWGTWCATCHEDMHSGTGNYVHPVDETIGSTIAQNYNQYVKSGDMTGGSGANAYTSLVPFVEGTGDYTILASHAVNNNTFRNGPASSDRVSCLSCHRAHASGMIYGLRYDIEYEFMTKEGDYVGSDNPAVGTTGRGPQQSRGRLIADWKAAYYDRPATQFSAYQRVLCNKCHAKD
jgi:hypothetical protein